MSRSRLALDAAVQSAGEVLARRGARFEVFARLGQTTVVTRDADGEWRRGATREVGVACRVAVGGRAGFAAAAGSGARAGREAARAALEAMVPDLDPLPPRDALGTAPAPPPAAVIDLEAQESFAREIAARLDRARAGLQLARVRTLGGASTATLATGEGFRARAEASGVVVELLVAPERGPWRHFHFAAREFATLDLDALARRAVDATLLTMAGPSAPHALADVLLAPAVAAPLVVALAQELVRPRDGASAPLRAGRVSRAWRLTDQRAGPEGLLPLPCDGEGMPSADLELIGTGRIGPPHATWADAQRTGAAAGGAVRPSYRHPPATGPANLVVTGAPGTSQARLLERLDNGFYLAVPAGPVRVEPGRLAFALRAAAVAIRRGRPVAAHPLVELRGSIRRLLAGLEAAGDDGEAFSLACAVTTPSLLFRRLGIASLA